MFFRFHNKEATDGLVDKHFEKREEMVGRQIAMDQRFRVGLQNTVILIGVLARILRCHCIYLSSDSMDFFFIYIIVANSNYCLCSAIILNICPCFNTFMHIQSYMTTCSFLNYLLSSSLSSSTYYHFTFNVNGIYLNLMY